MDGILPIIHRVNTTERLEMIPSKFGVEFDIRPYNDKLILSHEPFQNGQLLEDYLKNFKQTIAVLDIKAEWICEEVLSLTKKFGINNFFLLGVTIPETVALINKGVRNIAVRFSEYESIEGALTFAGKIDWVWVDTFTKFPLDKDSFNKLKELGFKICLVCPERWGRPEDISKYKRLIKSEGIEIDAVMTVEKYVSEWMKE